MNRSYYSADVQKFLKDDNSFILGELSRNHEFALEDLQRNSWQSQICILKDSLEQFHNASIAFEYSIPRMGKRVDVILLHAGIIFVLEFKVGESKYSKHAVDQVLDYSIDLKNFHEQSHNRVIIPIVIATEAEPLSNIHVNFPDHIYKPLFANKNNINEVISEATSEIQKQEQIDPVPWFDSIYKPTPTIIEAAQALYKGHSVREISRSDSGAINLGATSEAISNIIENSKRMGRKSICFVTGVPGAGKTLAGLNIANERHNIDADEHAVFLSGNGPLVQVLQEALARNEVDEKKGTDEQITKAQALTKTKSFIQNIHHFRDDAIQSELPPIEKVAVFDEAQRAWTLNQTRAFMSRKKGLAGFNMSEPEFLISVLDRHKDWSIIVCLIGGGQEINTGEAGLLEWFYALRNNYRNWDVYISDKLTDSEYSIGDDIYSMLPTQQLTVKSELHLAVSIRSFRSEKVSGFVKSVLDNDIDSSRLLFSELKNSYPIYVSRNLKDAKRWLKQKARGSEGIGVTASSGAYRLKPYGIHIKSEIEPKTWFLNGRDDIRSSGFLEEVATEFDIQGLELDWTCVAWDANLRFNGHSWDYKAFRGTVWQNINDDVRKRYLLNAYRVLLTRARQGMVIFVPEGDPSDETRLPEFYDPIFYYLTSCGIPVLHST
ncbi:MAG: DUF2075 domain-containing protein [Bacteroidetes bacterium]|nr:DUF2075 domain-containing protein [Bacteroidota bacterium]